MRSALPISASVIRTPISAVAYGAVAVSSMRLLVEEQRGQQGGYFLSVDQKTLSRLMAAKRGSEDLSDVLIRMAKAEVTVPNRPAHAFERIGGASMNGKDDRPVRVLLVDDSPGDIRLTQEAFRDADRNIDLHVASDGMEAMDFLRQQGVHGDAPRPDLILLDLNMPKMDGREVLAQIKGDASLKSIPTVILTTSEADEDIAKSYELQANSYISKPVELDAFEDVVKSIDNYWLTKVNLPRQAPIT